MGGIHVIEPKKLLIIGNGFDLAHGLPTSYVDFMEFSKRLKIIFTYQNSFVLYSSTYLENWDGNDFLKGQLKNIFVKRTKITSPQDNKLYTSNDKILDIFWDNLNNNIWWEYFVILLKNRLIKGENWIDFESEISEIIKWIDEIFTKTDVSYEQLKNAMIMGLKGTEKTQIFGNKSTIMKLPKDCTIKEFINQLYNDLERLIDALNIYLSYFVENIKISQLDLISEINPDYVISFNYTDTYQRTYNSHIPVCYIHGFCDSGNRKSNMVLGIDEYWEDDKKDSHTNMAIFKKFVQRIRKKNSTKYRVWIDEAEENNIKYFKSTPSRPKASLEVYMFGHSLDITDKDILFDFLNPFFTSITIYPYNYLDEGKLISNIIKIIGEDILIDKSTSNPSRFNTYCQDNNN